MSAATSDWNAQDAIDRDLLRRGEIEQLLAGYVDIVRRRCRTRCGPHGEDVAQQVFVRLWRELSDGKHGDGAKPFREIVNGVTAFACRGWEGTTLGRDAELEEWTQGHEQRGHDDVADEVTARVDVEEFISSLSESDGAVARLRMLESFEIDQIAQATGKTRNAVDQALYRIRRKWVAWVEN